VGKKVAELCAEKQISKVCFDRGGFTYHGRIQVRARRWGGASSSLPATDMLQHQAGAAQLACAGLLHLLQGCLHMKQGVVHMKTDCNHPASNWPCACL
jgi:hypothetical protein